MEKRKTGAESMILLFEKALKKEFFNYIDQVVEQKINQRLKTEEESKTLLDAKEVCNKYGICLSTLERYVRNGLKYSSQCKGGKRLFKQKDLEFFFENKKR